MNEPFLDGLHANPWSERLVDLADLNREASELVESQVLSIKNAGAGQAGVSSKSLLLLGPPGTGKTHLFARLRKRLGPRAVLVHLRPILHGAMTPSFILKEAIIQLGHASYQEFQADNLVGSLIGKLEGRGSEFPRAELVTYRELGDAERTERLRVLSDQLLEKFPDADEAFIDRLMLLPFVDARHRRALLGWLSGQECDPSQLARIGAGGSMPPENAVRSLRTLATVAASGSPLVLVFDQLENLVQRDGTEARIVQYGNLIAELIDSTRGLLVVQLALESEWTKGIEPLLNLSQSSRVVMKRAALTLPTAKQAEALLELWYKDLEAPAQPFPWPFSPPDLRQLLATPGLTPRMLLASLREAREGQALSLLERPVQTGETSSDLPAPRREPSYSDVLSEEWKQRLVSAHYQLDQAEERRSGLDVDRFRDGLLVASSFSGGVTFKALQNSHFQLEGVGEDAPLLAFVHQSHPASVAAALDRVIATAESRRVIVVREQWRPFLPTWKVVVAKQREALARSKVAWHELTREEAAQILALDDLLRAARSQDLCDARGRPLTEGQTREFIGSEVAPDQWLLVQRVAGGASHVSLANANQTAGIPDVTPAPQTMPRAAASEATLAEVRGVLLRLHVLSIDRMLREMHRSSPGVGRISVLGALNALGSRVHWYGRNIVAWRGNDE
jgi:hypothetical protein